MLSRDSAKLEAKNRWDDKRVTLNVSNECSRDSK